MKHAMYTNMLVRAPLRLVALVLLTLLLSLSGCSHAADPAALGPHPEAVLVRFYDNATFVRACGGSLIGSNLVLTAAHCAEGTTTAVVVAPAAGGQRATTSGIYTYGWTLGDPTMDPATRDDLALLALRSPINIPNYAAIQSTPCASCAVVHVGRGLDARGSFVVQSKALRVAADAPPQRPLAQFVAAPPAIADGGAFYRASTTGQPLIVGMMSGKGQASGGAYVAPLSDPVVQTWVRAIYKRVQPSAAGSKAKTTSLHVLDEDPQPGDGDQSSSSSSSSSSSGSSGSSGDDPVATPPADPSASSTSSTSSSGSNDPVTDAPTPPSSAEPVTPTSSAGDGSTPSGSPSGSSSSGDTPAAPDASGTQRDPANDSPTDEPPKASDTYEDGTAPQGLRSWPGSIPGVAPLKGVGNGDEVTTVQPGGNAVTVASPGDHAFDTDPQVASSMAGVANIYNSHGMPGTLVGDVPEDTVRGFMQDDKPLIVAACFGAAPMTGGSTIRRMVNEYGTDSNAATTYGCSGYATGTFQCTGAWMDANGQAVPPAEQQRLGMSQQQCSVNSMQRDPDGHVTIYWDQCKTGSSGSF